MPSPPGCVAGAGVDPLAGLVDHVQVADRAEADRLVEGDRDAGRAPWPAGEPSTGSERDDRRVRRRRAGEQQRRGRAARRAAAARQPASHADASAAGRAAVVRRSATSGAGRAPGGSARSARSSATTSTSPATAARWVASRSSGHRAAGDVADRQRASTTTNVASSGISPAARRGASAVASEGDAERAGSRPPPRGRRAPTSPCPMLSPEQRRQADRRAAPAPTSSSAGAQQVPAAQHPAGGQHARGEDRARPGRARGVTSSRASRVSRVGSCDPSRHNRRRSPGGVQRRADMPIGSPSRRAEAASRNRSHLTHVLVGWSGAYGSRVTFMTDGAMDELDDATSSPRRPCAPAGAMPRPRPRSSAPPRPTSGGCARTSARRGRRRRPDPGDLRARVRARCTASPAARRPAPGCCPSPGGSAPTRVRSAVARAARLPARDRRRWRATRPSR